MGTEPVNFRHTHGSLPACARSECRFLMLSRRLFLGTSLASVASALTWPAAARSHGVEAPVSPALLARALDALERHRDTIVHRDLIGLADFALPSRAPRFHLVRVADRSTRSFLVAHGRGSDPQHTGWLQRFSNEPRSNASSAGAYLTGHFYFGAHGHSLHLEGLDPTNSNAAARAIVVHGAWYVSEDMVGRCGVLGRSEGCLAVDNSSLEEVLTALGAGRLIYADRA